MSGVIDTTGLSDGEHIVYLQAIDSAGNEGVVSAEFLYVIDVATSPQISGVVTGAGTGVPLEATITAGPFSTTSDPATGSYTLYAAAGEYSVTATPVDTGFGPATVDAVTAADGTITTVDFNLFPFCDVFADDVEDGSVGWTTTGSWARTEETSFSPTFSWTDSPGGNYGNNQNVTLTSPGIDLSGVTAAELNFAQICDTEANYDFCIIEVSGDGSTWSEIARYDLRSGTTWNTRTLDVSQLAGSANARIRFRLDTDFSVLEDGWHIDDISIRTSGAQCVTVVDTDNDGVFDDTDNCTIVANAGQLDADGDGYGNICDGDFDNNGVTNFLDLSIFADAFSQVGALETDLNGDGVTNFLDLALFSDMYLQPPGPSGAAAP
ncbi:MAG: hypothetical protein HKN70_00785 [Gammaproteobacteria bacterium]|nr:hypothetical protein [Gammaproteobacteria bacterium]